MIRFLLITALTVALLLFGLANLHVVELYTLFGGGVHASLAFLLLGAFVAGFLIATVVSMQQIFRLRKRERVRERERLEQQRFEEPRLPALPPPPQIPLRGEGRISASRLSHWR